jgi:internalin A
MNSTLDNGTYQDLKNKLAISLGEMNSIVKTGDIMNTWTPGKERDELQNAIAKLYGHNFSKSPYGKLSKAQGAGLRILQAFLKEKDPEFGGLIRVRNRRNEFLWIHPKFEKEYNLDPPVFPK